MLPTRRVNTNRHVFYVQRHCTFSRSLTPFSHLDHCVIPLEHSSKFFHLAYSTADAISKVRFFAHLEMAGGFPVELQPLHVGVRGEGMYDVTIIHINLELPHYNPSVLPQPARRIQLTSLGDQLVRMLLRSLVPVLVSLLCVSHVCTTTSHFNRHMIGWSHRRTRGHRWSWSHRRTRWHRWRWSHRQTSRHRWRWSHRQTWRHWQRWSHGWMWRHRRRWLRHRVMCIVPWLL